MVSRQASDATVWAASIEAVGGQRTWLWQEALGQEDLGVEERMKSALQRKEVLAEERAAA